MYEVGELLEYSTCSEVYKWLFEKFKNGLEHGATFECMFWLPSYRKYKRWHTLL